MLKLNQTELLNLLMQLGIMLIAGRIMAEAARKFKQPAVVGEIIAGIHS
jgi:Kef-type K+ transport system membrane component KefB